MADQKTPMDVMRAISPVAARTYMEQRVAVMDNADAKAIDSKTKLLIGIGVASALQSEVCTMMWVKQARQAGASNAEIAEAIMVARLMKAATVNDTAAKALDWLASQGA
jgi:AhpD family alkylhydroperoxidase